MPCSSGSAFYASRTVPDNTACLIAPVARGEVKFLDIVDYVEYTHDTNIEEEIIDSKGVQLSIKTGQRKLKLGPVGSCKYENNAQDAGRGHPGYPLPFELPSLHYQDIAIE